MSCQKKKRRLDAKSTEKQHPLTSFFKKTSQTDDNGSVSANTSRKSLVKSYNNVEVRNVPDAIQSHLFRRPGDDVDLTTEYQQNTEYDSGSGISDNDDDVDVDESDSNHNDNHACDTNSDADEDQEGTDDTDNDEEECSSGKHSDEKSDHESGNSDEQSDDESGDSDEQSDNESGNSDEQSDHEIEDKDEQSDNESEDKDEQSDHESEDIDEQSDNESEGDESYMSEDENEGIIKRDTMPRKFSIYKVDHMRLNAKNDINKMVSEAIQLTGQKERCVD